MGGRLLDWLGQGVAADRPDAATMVPDRVPSGSAAMYFANDTKIINFFDESGPSWFEIDAAALSAIAFETMPDVDWSTPPTDGQYFKWDLTSGKVIPTDLPPIPPGITTEEIQDIFGAMITNGSGMDVTYDDGSGTILFTCSLIQYTDEMAADAIAALIAAGVDTGLAITYDDAGNSLSFTVSGAWVDARADARIAALVPAIADTRANARIAAASIDALADVDTTSVAPTDGQAMVWDATNHLWKPGTVSGGGGSTITWANGSGNKRLFMSATAVGGANSPNTSLGAAPSNSFYFNGGGSCSVTFDFQTAIKVQAIAVLFDLAAGNQGNWTVEASPDNATWTTLLASQAYTPVTTNGLPNVTFNFASNVTAYRYYRLRQLTGVTSSSAYVNQFLFKSEPIG